MPPAEMVTAVVAHTAARTRPVIKAGLGWPDERPVG
ncbi:hypothetical protein DFR70_12237 [Nocardia tenerifensis]|uniref:Uncharacterized protein n=1 Tax=Nocardia tenerifensis TaxID=228006 RepID=A0A318JNC0_9NOCA|nr:hypothetical protein DFR70_12237 [Nocardia tenerifensis]